MGAKAAAGPERGHSGDNGPNNTSVAKNGCYRSYGGRGVLNGASKQFWVREGREGETCLACVVVTDTTSPAHG